jgi:hypothetical protein
MMGRFPCLARSGILRTGGKEEGLFRGITNRITLFEGKEEVLKDVPVSKVAPKSQDEMIAQYIMLYDTERVNRLARAEAEAKAKGQSPFKHRIKLRFLLRLLQKNKSFSGGAAGICASLSE